MQNTSLILQAQKSELQSVPRKRIWPLQIPAALSACLLRLGYGAAHYWTSPALPHLIKSHSKFTITPDEGSWIVSLYPFGGIIGFILYPQFFNRIGRKYTMLLFAVIQFFSWIIMYYATKVQHLYVARILAGIGYNVGYIVEIIYVGEISEKNIRGLLVILGKIAYSLGTLIVVILGAFVSYDNMNLILLLISLLFIVTFPFMPESPYFYLQINREEDAFQSLSKLRGSCDVSALQLEIDGMKEGITKNGMSKANSLLKLFKIAKNRKALFISCLATLSMNFSGSPSIGAYTQTIVSHFDTSLKPEHTTILVMLVLLISSIVLAPIPDWAGRRILTLSYGILIALSAATIGAFFFYKYYFNGDLSSISWIPVCAFVFYLIAGNTGLFSLSNILLSELFSLDVKNIAPALINIITFITVFLLNLNFERLVNVFEFYGVFWIFGTIGLIMTLANFMIMPETKGKTLEEIQKLLEQVK